MSIIRVDVNLLKDDKTNMSDTKKRIIELYDRYLEIINVENGREVQEICDIVDELFKLLDYGEKIVKLNNGKFLSCYDDGESFLEHEEIE